jgi:hypothetical protein
MNYSLYSNLLNVNDQGSRAAAIYKYWDLVSDELVQMGPDIGKYWASYVCWILGEDGPRCERRERAGTVRRGNYKTNPRGGGPRWQGGAVGVVVVSGGGLHIHITHHHQPSAQPFTFTSSQHCALPRYGASMPLLEGRWASAVCSST